MKDNGDTIYSMDKEKKCGQMVLSMKESMFKERNTGMVSIVGTMDQDMMGNGLRIKLRGQEHILGLMEGNSKDNG